MDLGDLILSACKSRGLSLAAVCKQAGLRYSTLHSQIHNHREIPFTSIDRLATALNLPLSHFSGNQSPMTFEPVPNANTLQVETARLLSDLVNKQVAAMTSHGYQVSIDDMLDWLIANNNQLVNCKELIDWVNLYLPTKPGDRIPTPYRIGSKSLSAKYFRILEVKTYTEVINCYDDKARQEIVQAHIDCADKPYLIMDKKIDTVSDGIRIRGTYRRLLAPVRDVDGKKLTLGFSKLTHFTGA
jgi:transcriptional regulator with XRE-family HTH domain